MLCLVRLAINSNINNNHIQGAMSTLLNSINVLNDDIQRMNEEIHSDQHPILVLVQQCSLLKILVKAFSDCMSRIEINQNVLYQQLLSLKEDIEDSKTTSFDGTLTWKITNFQEKRCI